MIRLTLLLLVLVSFVSCTKKDWHVFEHLKRQKACVVESMNAERQGSDDFYFVKTVNERGLVTHIKTQLRDIHSMTYVLDYSIHYSFSGATLKGVTKAYNWFNSDPEDPTSALLSEEVIELRDASNIEVKFDRVHRKPIEVRYGAGGESVLELIYNQRGFLTKVGEFNVATDTRGNIRSITTPPYEGEYYHGQQTGVWFHYSDDSTKRKFMYYETPNIFVNRMYSLLEVLNWGDLQTDRERTSVFLEHAYGDEAYPVQPALYVDYSDHVYDADGKLLQYTFFGDFYQAIPYTDMARTLTRSIAWRCNEVVKPAAAP